MGSNCVPISHQRTEQTTARGDQVILPPGLPSSTQDVEPQQSAAAAALRIVYYTDPLCSWSWAFEPQWRRLRYEFGAQVHWSYRMGGMIADWQQYADPFNDVSRPVQMGPQWFQVRTLTEMPLVERIWLEDPPASSYPACIAVKAAERQGTHYGEVYLRRVREAVMVESRNVARRDVLLAVAQAVAETVDDFDVEQFALDLADQQTVVDFRQDLQDVRYREIGRFPAFALLNATGRGIMLVGYRPYTVLRQALTHFMPELEPVRHASNGVEYINYWGRATAREVAEALEQQTGQAEQALAQAVAQGQLVQHGVFYQSRTSKSTQ